MCDVRGGCIVLHELRWRLPPRRRRVRLELPGWHVHQRIQLSAVHLALCHLLLAVNHLWHVHLWLPDQHRDGVVLVLLLQRNLRQRRKLPAVHLALHHVFGHGHDLQLVSQRQGLLPEPVSQLVPERYHPRSHEHVLPRVHLALRHLRRLGRLVPELHRRLFLRLGHERVRHLLSSWYRRQRLQLPSVHLALRQLHEHDDHELYRVHRQLLPVPVVLLRDVPLWYHGQYDLEHVPRLHGALRHLHGRQPDLVRLVRRRLLPLQHHVLLGLPCGNVCQWHHVRAVPVVLCHLPGPRLDLHQLRRRRRPLGGDVLGDGLSHGHLPRPQRNPQQLPRVHCALRGMQRVGNHLHGLQRIHVPLERSVRDLLSHGHLCRRLDQCLLCVHPALQRLHKQRDHLHRVHRRQRPLPEHLPERVPRWLCPAHLASRRYCLRQLLVDVRYVRQLNDHVHVVPVWLGPVPVDLFCHVSARLDPHVQRYRLRQLPVALRDLCVWEHDDVPVLRRRLLFARQQRDVLCDLPRLDLRQWLDVRGLLVLVRHVHRQPDHMHLLPPWPTALRFDLREQQCVSRRDLHQRNELPRVPRALFQLHRHRLDVHELHRQPVLLPEPVLLDMPRPDHDRRQQRRLWPPHLHGLLRRLRDVRCRQRDRLHLVPGRPRLVWWRLPQPVPLRRDRERRRQQHVHRVLDSLCLVRREHVGVHVVRRWRHPLWLDLRERVPLWYRPGRRRVPCLRGSLLYLCVQQYAVVHVVRGRLFPVQQHVPVLVPLGYLCRWRRVLGVHRAL